MRKLLIIVLSLFMINSFIKAQKFYIKASPSYNLPVSNQVLTTNQNLSYVAGIDKIIDMSTNVRSSLGKGILGNLTFGFQNNKNFSTELNFSYLYGFPTTSTETVVYYIGKDVATRKFTGNLFSIAPTLVFTPEGKTWRPFFSIGIPINFISFNQVYDFTSFDFEDYMHVEVEYSGNPVIGFTSKLGLIREINPRISVFTEAAFSYISFSPDKDQITAYTINNKDSISQLNTSELNTEYVEEVKNYYEYISGSWVETWDTDKARKKKKFDMQFSSISLTIGVRVNLFKAKTDK